MRAVARKSARAEAAIIFWGMGISQHVHGTDNARCLIALSLISGQIGRPGTGLHPLRGQNNVQGASDVGLIPMFFPDYISVEDSDWLAFYEKLWNAQIGRQALSPPGDARHDLWIIQELSRRIGLEWNYRGPADVFAELKQGMRSLDNITWDRVARESSVTYPCAAPDAPGADIVFGDGFPTKSGRGRLVPDEQYPMVLMSARQLEHWHTGAMTRRSAALDAIEPEAHASLSPLDLDRMGLAPGTMVRVVTRRGAIDLKVRSDRDIPAGMVSIPFCYAEAAANILTNPQLDPDGKIPEFKFCAARVEPLATPIPVT